MKVIDSDIFVDALRGVEKAENWLQKAVEAGGYAFSSITESELLSGKACNEKEKREALLYLLSMFEKISIDNPISQIAGDFRRKYGVLIPDAIVAASAFHTGSILVTRNEKDFSAIKEIKVEVPY